MATSSTTVPTPPAKEPGPCRARLVGPPQLLAGSTSRALERHDAAMLALLALDGPMPRARMAAWLWPDVPQTVARSHLRQRLLRLRRAVGVDWITPDGRLGLADNRVDLQTAAATLVAEPSTALQGDLLEGLDYSDIDGLDDWVNSARARWRRRRVELLTAQAAAHETAHRVAAALAFASRIVQEEPLLEIAHRRVMRLHCARGDRAAALVAARACVDVLGRELGIEPDAETRALICSIKTGAHDVPRTRAPELGRTQPIRWLAA